MNPPSAKAPSTGEDAGQRKSLAPRWSPSRNSEKTRWKRVTIPDWYGEGARVIEIVSNTAVWYHSGQPPVPIRWVLIRDPKGKFKTQALLCYGPDRENPSKL